jgi:hypothetical protein
MRIDWASVGRMIERVVAEHAATRGTDGLDGLTRIGIDEVAYRKGHRYLMCVVCHDSGRVVWAHEGRSQAVCALFFQQLGPQRCEQIQAVSVDLRGEPARPRAAVLRVTAKAWGCCPADRLPSAASARHGRAPSDLLKGHAHQPVSSLRRRRRPGSNATARPRT